MESRQIFFVKIRYPGSGGLFQKKEFDAHASLLLKGHNGGETDCIRTCIPGRIIPQGSVTHSGTSVTKQPRLQGVPSGKTKDLQAENALHIQSFIVLPL